MNTNNLKHVASFNGSHQCWLSTSQCVMKAYTVYQCQCMFQFVYSPDFENHSVNISVQAGTYFYHGHLGLQRVGGLFGSLIVKLPLGKTEPFAYDEEIEPGSEMTGIISPSMSKNKDWWAYYSTLSAIRMCVLSLTKPGFVSDFKVLCYQKQLLILIAFLTYAQGS